MNSNTVIISAAEFLPGPPIDNQRMEKVFGLRADWIDQTIGTKTRHYAVNLDTKRPVFNLCEMCVRAGQAAIERAQIDPRDIEVVVLSTATPDHLMPSTVNLVCERLGLDEVSTYQIQAGCAGAVQALQVASALLQSGRGGKALVLSGDTSYKFFDFSRDFVRLPPSELINLALFGDGAGAAILSASPKDSGLVLSHSINRLEGADILPGHILNWLAPQGAAPTDGESAQAAREDYKAIEERVPRMARELLGELLTVTRTKVAEIDYFLPPQLAGHMSERIIRSLELDRSRCISRVAEVGNAGNATPYFQLTRLFEVMEPGQQAILLAIESSKWLKTGVHFRKVS